MQLVNPLHSLRELDKQRTGPPCTSQVKPQKRSYRTNQLEPEFLREAFVNAARGLLYVIVEGEDVRPERERIVAVHASDTDQLLVRWLSEVLFLVDAERFVPVDFDLLEFSETYLRARLRGEQYDEGRHESKIDVKAITYHQLKIEEHEGRSSVTVFVDI